MPRSLFLAAILFLSSHPAWAGPNPNPVAAVPLTNEQKALTLLKPPLPDIAGKKLLPDALFAACKSPGNDFRCVDYLAVAIALQTLPPAQAEAQLRQWTLGDAPGLGLRSRTLCLMMFEPRPGEPFDPPWIKADFVQIVDGIPFVRGFGGLGGRTPDPAYTYFDYCYMHGQWTTRRYHPATPAELQAALSNLLDVLSAKGPVTDFERKHLQTEIAVPPVISSSKGE